MRVSGLDVGLAADGPGVEATFMSLFCYENVLKEYSFPHI